MPLLHEIILASLPHAYTLLVLLTALLGEEVVLVFVVFSAQHFFPLSAILILGLGTTILVDIILFYLSRDLLHKRISNWKKVINVSKDIRNFAHKVHTENLLLMLTIRRFLVGTRHATTLYLGTKKMSWNKFMFYNTLSLLIWSVFMIPIAWFAGKGFTVLLRFATRIEKLVFFTIVFVIIIILIEKLLSRIASKIN